MSFRKGFWKHQGVTNDEVPPRDGMDPETDSAIRNFRQSVHAWSDATYQRARTVQVATPMGAWRRAAAFALGGVLVAGGAAGGYREYQHRQEQARVAAARQAEQQRQLREQRARQAEEELAQVDRDISRQIPDALEPLGRLMTTDESQ